MNKNKFFRVWYYHLFFLRPEIIKVKQNGRKSNGVNDSVKQKIKKNSFFSLTKNCWLYTKYNIYIAIGIPKTTNNLRNELENFTSSFSMTLKLKGDKELFILIDLKDSLISLEIIL